uniref:Bax inhibitor 1 n=1 Tax=Plectus sambesii TaxID=2011161 RepID=A0A914V7T1_9BILA
MAQKFMHYSEQFFGTLDQKLEKSVKNHLKDVYSVLAIGLLAAATGAYVHVCTDLLRGNLLTSLGSMAILLLLYATPDNGNNQKLRLGYFMGFAGLSGLGTGPLLDMAVRLNPSIVVTAFFGTCVVFICFTIAALYAPDRKFLYLGGILMSAVSTMFWMGLLNLFFASRFIFQLNLYAGLIVMCGFVLYDTQLIIEKRRRNDTDFIWHAVELFIDFLDIFRRLLIILSQKESNEKKRKD